MLKRWSQFPLASSLLLMLLILVTRSQHFGTPYMPPDATWGAFFLAGLFAPAWLFAALLVVAALADQIAFASGVSDWCVTAAYAFLIPTYGAMWMAGYLCRGTRFLDAVGAGKLVGLLALGGAVAFAISNASFFLLSGYFTDMSAVEYTSRVLRYAPQYLVWAGVYALGGILVAALWRKYWPAGKQPQKV
jgi:hypothetical protein